MIRPPAGSTSETSEETSTPPRRRKSTSRREGRTSAGPICEGFPWIQSHHQPDLRLCPQWPGFGDHRGSSTAGPSSCPSTRGATSSPTTRRTGSATDPRRERERHRRVQLRAAQRLTGRTLRRHRLSVRGPDGGSTTSTSATRTPQARSGSKVRRIRFVGPANLPPVAVASAQPTEGPPPLVVTFSSLGTSDPEGAP